jgi:hypothetical protein
MATSLAQAPHPILGWHARPSRWCRNPHVIAREDGSVSSSGHPRPPLAPALNWAGLGVLTAWAAAELLTGGLQLQLRDA